MKRIPTPLADHALRTLKLGKTLSERLEDTLSARRIADGPRGRSSLQEVSELVRPEHVPGSGHELVYLSRFFAPWWRHISVNFNH